MNLPTKELGAKNNIMVGDILDHTPAFVDQSYNFKVIAFFLHVCL